MTTKNKRVKSEAGRRFPMVFPQRIWAMLQVILARRAYGYNSTIICEAVEDLYRREVGDPLEQDPIALLSKIK